MGRHHYLGLGSRGRCHWNYGHWNCRSTLLSQPLNLEVLLFDPGLHLRKPQLPIRGSLIGWGSLGSLWRVLITPTTSPASGTSASAPSRWGKLSSLSLIRPYGVALTPGSPPGVHLVRTACETKSWHIRSYSRRAY